MTWVTAMNRLIDCQLSTVPSTLKIIRIHFHARKTVKFLVSVTNSPTCLFIPAEAPEATRRLRSASSGAIQVVVANLHLSARNGSGALKVYPTRTTLLSASRLLILFTTWKSKQQFSSLTTFTACYPSQKATTLPSRVLPSHAD
jgi:hypothetical protein